MARLFGDIISVRGHINVEGFGQHASLIFGHGFIAVNLRRSTLAKKRYLSVCHGAEIVGSEIPVPFTPVLSGCAFLH